MVYVQPIIWEADLIIPWHKTNVHSKLDLKKEAMGQKNKKNVSWIPTKKNRVSVPVVKPAAAVATLQAALRTTLLVGQAFSLIPVQGVAASTAKNVK
ncbi:hypothetical protein JYU34_011156 [Plutella xylostella]|uniref:Uncharacterized protein n=1 Tax=Plutella xylostella TaxID=51655 RepID=A0ABQ7QH03_PLUXY|nr:hypothetical protein JYU34_011156 [Plutella xylostella]